MATAASGRVGGGRLVFQGPDVVRAQAGFTEAAFRALLEASGLRISRIVTAPPTAFSVIETSSV